jgi:hypothetical protein
MLRKSSSEGALYQGTASQLAEKLGRVEVLKGHDFSRADKTNEMSYGFSHCGMFFVSFRPSSDFFRSLFSRADKANKMSRASATEACSQLRPQTKRSSPSSARYTLAAFN